MMLMTTTTMMMIMIMMGEHNSESDTDAHSSVITARIAVLMLGFEATRARLFLMPGSPTHGVSSYLLWCGPKE